ncbi:hypothetical protein ABGB19_17925 [Mycobacterium sp. B14F4]|uniref:hypothetical protein n=1 Tax=Mycobacterium sp. B14F4 TaxID=3153565 RepID=UPI00325C420D
MSALPDDSIAAPHDHFDRPAADYRDTFLGITHEMHQRCPTRSRGADGDVWISA